MLGEALIRLYLGLWRCCVVATYKDANLLAEYKGHVFLKKCWTCSTCEW